MGAIASLFRFQGGVILIVVFTCIFIGKAPFQSKMRRAILLLAGALATYLDIYIYLYLKGASDSAIFWSFIFGLKYAAQGEAFAFWPRFLSKVSLWIFSVLPLIAVACVFAWRKLRERPLDRRALYVIIWFLLMWWPVCLGRRFFSHYFLMLLPPLAIMAGAQFASIRKPAVRNIFLGTLALWTCFFFLTRIDSLGIREISGIHASDWEEDVRDMQCPVGRYIGERTTPNERIFIWGFASPIYLCSGRLPTGRLLSADALVGRISGGRRFMEGNAVQDMGALGKKLWDEVFSDLEKRPPAYIVDVSSSEFGAFKDYPIEKYPIFQWMKDRGYKFENSVSGARLWRQQSGDHAL
jgi:hypothetical protein